MNPSEFELYDSPASGSVALVYTCRACGRFCQCTVLEWSTGPFSCPCGDVPEWRPLRRRRRDSLRTAEEFSS